MARSAKGGDLIAVLEPYFTKQAPFQIPASGRNVIVKWLPWVNLVIGIILLPLVLGVLGLATAIGVVANAVGVGTGPFYWLSMLVLGVSIAILFVTFPGLKAKKLSAWKMIVWADILYFIYSVLTGLSSPVGLLSNIFGGLITLVIGLYILYQIKGHYK